MKRILAFVFLFSLSATAHEGHDHGPAKKIAPHGGVLREGAKFMMELVQKGASFKLYPLEKDGTAAPIKEVFLDAKASSLKDPKGNSVPVSFVVKDDFLTIDFKTTGSHRYALTVVAKHDGVDHKFQWQVEPQGE